MELFEAINQIHKQFPELPETEIRAAMDSEVKHTEAELSGRSKYARAVEIAHRRICIWLSEGAETYSRLDLAELDIDRLCYFVSTYRQACVWAVLRSKQAKLKEQQQAAAAEQSQQAEAQL